MNALKFFFSFTIVLLIVVWGVGCDQANPVGSAQSSQAVSQPTVTPTTLSVSGDGESLSLGDGGSSSSDYTTPDYESLQFITLPNREGTSSGNKSASGLVSASLGGTLSLNYSYKTSTGQIVRVAATFSVAPGALKRDTYISFQMKDGHLGFNFSPEGLVFARPALLNVQVTGLSSSNLASGSQVYCQWWNAVDEVWVRMDATTILSSTATGSFSCLGGKIPHFSEYAFGR